VGLGEAIGGRRDRPLSSPEVSKAYPHVAQAINCDGDRAAKMIQDALGIEKDDVVNYCFPKEWPADRERRARYIGEWLKTEARYLA
jgi:hypothetical protein